MKCSTCYKIPPTSRTVGSKIGVPVNFYLEFDNIESTQQKTIIGFFVIIIFALDFAGGKEVWSQNMWIVNSRIERHTIYKIGYKVVTKQIEIWRSSR